MLINQTLSLSDCQLKFANSEGEFSGYGSVFGNIDSKNDIIMPGAYSEVLKQANKVPVYVNHGWIKGDLPVGYWSDLKQDDIGLVGSASLVMQMSAAKDAYWGMKSGLVTGLSVAIIPDHKTSERRSDGVRVIHNIKALKEISIVTDPANEAARVIDVKFNEVAAALIEVKTVRDFEGLLRDVGAFDQETAKLIVSKAKEVFGWRDANEENDASLELIAAMKRIKARIPL